jgi:predicted AAA+ superfamily ATPase
MHGQTLNTSSLARAAGVARQTIASYVQVLEDTLLATTLSAFETKLRVRERRHPKFYLFDAGVARALKRNLGPVAAEERGSLFEGFVLMLLRFYRERDELWDDIAYWAPAEAKKTEVDFVLTRGREAIAVEVKATRTVRPDDLRGLRAIADLRGLARRILVFQGPHPLKMPDGIEAWPVETFARALAEGTIWP